MRIRIGKSNKAASDEAIKLLDDIMGRMNKTPDKEEVILSKEMREQAKPASGN